MAITFIPKRGAILMCDFDMAFVPPEMIKFRQAVVLSVQGMNHRHGTGPGLCTVIPFSTVPPATPGIDDIFFPAGRYRSLKKDSWAKCRMVCTMSHDRLDLVRGLRRTEFLAPHDMVDIETAVSYVLGIP